MVSWDVDDLSCYPHCAIWDKNPNGLVAVRNEKFLDSVSNIASASDVDRERILAAYTEPKNSAVAESLKMLKESVRSSLSAGQVVGYDCTVVGVDRCDNSRLQLAGLEHMADSVLQFLEQKIDKQFPKIEQIPVSDFEAQRIFHEDFAEQHSGAVLGREAETRRIEEYIANDFGKLSQASTLRCHCLIL